MEKVIMKAQELSRLVHEVKGMSHSVISKVKKLHDDTIETCTELTDRAHKLSEELDKIVSSIEIKTTKEE